MKQAPFFSIIIPVRTETDYLKETLSQLKHQTFSTFEVLVITDRVSGKSEPSFKRNLGANKARGAYLAFLDDDSYPHPDWLKNCFQQIKQHPEYAAFCGPCLTPPQDNIYQQASGIFLASRLGSGGAGDYRNTPKPARFVDDYPTVNLIVNKKVFDSIGGFNSKYWPGEDTILCLDIVSRLQQKIYYHPSLVVYHHRRQVLFPHLQQIKRYALHRGFFAKKYPQTSRRLGYFIPSLFFTYCLSLFFLYSHFPLLILPFYLYLALLINEFIYHALSQRQFFLSFLVMVTTFSTHLYYGFYFIIGLISPEINSRPHQVDRQTGNYLGG